MTNRFNRTSFLTSVVVEGKEEFDLISNSINDFKFLREKTFYKVTEEDLQRPDLIAMKAYRDVGSIGYWWIIMYLNDIHDIWNDLVVGNNLLIPNKKDLEDFVTFSRII